MISRLSLLPKRALLRAFVGAMMATSALTLAVVAYAYWGAPGNGVGIATAGTVNPPATVTISSFGPTVTVNWTAVPPPGGVLAGYTVTRYAGTTPSNACGTDPASIATFIPAGTLTCSDTSVPDGTYAYTVTAVFRSWTAQSAQSNAVTVVGAETTPNQSVTLAPGATNAYFVGATLYYRATAAGSFQLVDTVTGVASAPASAAFPAIGTTGWTHPAETVTSGTGSDPTIAYTSSSFGWTSLPANPAPYSVTGSDTLGNTVNTPIAFTSDTTGPTGGALTVNTTTASTGGTTSTTNANFSIDVRADYSADVGSGLATSVLTSEAAPLTNNTCGAFGETTQIIGNPAQTGLATGCYRYTLTGTDNVGNASSISTIVKNDTSASTQAVTLTSGVGASQTGNIVYFRTTVPGSFSLSSAVTDAETSPASVTFPLIITAGWTHPAQTVSSGTGSPPTIAYSSSSYSFTTTAGVPGTHSVVGTDNAGNTVTTALTFVKDTTGPTGGALTVNSVTSSTAGTSSFNKTGGFTIGTRTDYTVDAGAGVGSSVLTVAFATLSANTCGTFGTASVITGSPAQSALTTGCWKYVLTGTDKVGNVAAPTFTTVKVDLVAPPAGGAVTVNGLAASTAGTTSGPTNAASFPIDSRTEYTVDPETNIKTSTLGRASAPFSAGACGTFGSATTQVGTPLQSALATACYKYALTGTDNALNATSISTIVKYDIIAPTAGALTVNGTAASAAGTSSTANAASFTIGTRTANTDAASGLASSILTRQFATLTGSTCSSFGSATTIPGSPVQTGLATGCYLYTLTGTDNAGNTTVISTTVKLGVYVTALSLTNGTGTAGRPDQGDQIVVTFSDQLDVSTLCSTWSGNGADQAINGDNQATVSLNTGAGSDTVTVSSSVCTLNFGTLSLGSTAYTTATDTFAGAGANKSTIAWNWSAKQLTITLGQVTGAGQTTVATSIVTYTPSTSVLNISGVPTGGTLVTANVKQF